MRKAFLLLHTAVFLAGFTGVLGRLITINEGLLVWYRLLITSLTMWLLFGLLKRIQKIPIAAIGKLFFIGFTTAAHWVTFFGSIKYANISVALVCFSSVGFFTAILEPLLLRQKVNIVNLLLGLLVMVGIYIIFHFDTNYKTGIILGVVSAILIAVVMIYLHRFMQRYNAETVLCWQITGGFLTLSLFMPFYLSWFPVKNLLPGWTNFGWLLLLAWGCSVWAFQLTANALKKISAFTVNLTYNLEPLYGILLAFLIYKENNNLQWPFYVGAGLIVLSVVLQTCRVMKPAKAGRNKK
jgi:drug/metabolite transporter (DMT)-like permease